jgi:hypothetical protein
MENADRIIESNRRRSNRALIVRYSLDTLLADARLASEVMDAPQYRS